jgi:hypothetical protein
MYFQKLAKDLRFSGILGSVHPWKSCPLKMGPRCCPQKLLKDYHSTMCNIPEQRGYNQHCGGSLKSELAKRGVEWLHLAQDKDKWQTLVNTNTFGSNKTP